MSPTDHPTTAGNPRRRQGQQNHAARRHPRITRANHQAVSKPMTTTAIIIAIHTAFVAIGFSAGVGWEKWRVEDRKIKAEQKTLRDRMAEAAHRTSEWSRDI